MGCSSRCLQGRPCCFDMPRGKDSRSTPSDHEPIAAQAYGARRRARHDPEPIMTIQSSTAFIAVAIASIVAVTTAQAQQAVARPDTSGYVAANGVDYWFEIRGKGEPLLLLHGGLFTTEMFGPVLTKLAENRRVIGIHLQGHGRTALGTRKISLVDIGRDLGVVLPKLGLRQVDVMGYSFGGGAAFQLAVQHPALVRRLVLVSTPYAQNGFFAEMLP